MKRTFYFYQDGLEMSLDKGKKVEFASVLADIISCSQLSPEDAHFEVGVHK